MKHGFFSAVAWACQVYCLRYGDGLEDQIRNNENELETIAANPTPSKLRKAKRLREEIARSEERLKRFRSL